MGRGEHGMQKPVLKPFAAVQWRKDEGLGEEVQEDKGWPHRPFWLHEFHEVRHK